jgi:ribosome-binding factor A
MLGAGGRRSGGKRRGNVDIKALNDRAQRVNSVLQNELAVIIRDEVKNPNISPHTTISEVDITNDLEHCKVWISVVGSPDEREKTMQALNQSAGFIRSMIAKRVRMRRHPHLYFKLDLTVDRVGALDSLFAEVEAERQALARGEQIKRDTDTDILSMQFGDDDEDEDDDDDEW